MATPGTSKRRLVDDALKLLAKNDGIGGGNPHTFKVRYCMFFAIYGFIKGKQNMQIRYKLSQEESGKFDDICFNDGYTNYYIKTIYTTSKKNQKISGTRLFSNTYNDAFNLLKYVDSVHECIKKDNSKAIVLTNCTFNTDSEDKMRLRHSAKKTWTEGITEIKLEPEKLDDCFAWLDTSKIKCYKFKGKNVVTILKRETSMKLFNEPGARKGKYENLSEADIEKALEHILYTVNAPNEVKIEKIIKDQLKNYFHLYNGDYLYAVLENKFINWCNNKETFFETQANRHVIKFNDINEFFKNHVKGVSFGVASSTSSFIGRKKQLMTIVDAKNSSSKKKLFMKKPKQSSKLKVAYCIYFAIYGHTRCIKNLQIRFQENGPAGNRYEDILFYDGSTNHYIQIKESKKASIVQEKINESQLFNTEFDNPIPHNLLKYIILVHESTKININVLTNINFDIHSQNILKLNYFKVKLKNIQGEGNWVKEITEIKLESEKLDKCFTWCESSDMTCYKFKDKNIATILNLQEDLRRIKKKLLEEPIKLEKLTEGDIAKALEQISYTVNISNELEIEKIIKNQLKIHFQLHNAENLYNLLENKFNKWCNNRIKIHENQREEHIIELTDIDTILNVKNFSFNVPHPDLLFTGRINELKEIKTKFFEGHYLIISQSEALRALRGIGKSSLVKEFIKRYGKEDFCDRVVWIEAENDEAVKDSFEDLATFIDERDKSARLSNEQSIKTKIKNIFEYFRELKVLFVFDQYEDTFENDKLEKHEETDLVVYCRKVANGLDCSEKPYIIITSRNRKCFLDVDSIDLNLFTKEENDEFTNKHLENTPYNREDLKNAEQRMLRFPTSLQQILTLINSNRKK